VNGYNFYFKQLVAHGDLNQLETDIDSQISSVIAQLFGAGWLNTPVITQTLVPSLAVLLPTLLGYDGSGERVQTTVGVTLNLTNDGFTPIGATGTVTGNGSVISVPGGGFERWLSIFGYHSVLQTDPRVDGAGNPLFYRLLDSFQFRVIAGTIAATGTAVKPTLPGDNGILLTDVLLTPTGIIVNSNIDQVRRQDLLTIAQGVAETITARNSTPKLTIFPNLKARLDAGETDLVDHKQPTQDDHSNYLLADASRALSSGPFLYGAASREFNKKSTTDGGFIRQYTIDEGGGNKWYEETWNAGRVLASGTPTSSWNGRDIAAPCYLERIGIGLSNYGFKEVWVAATGIAGSVPSFSLVLRLDGLNSATTINGSSPSIGLVDSSDTIASIVGKNHAGSPRVQASFRNLSALLGRFTIDDASGTPIFGFDTASKKMDLGNVPNPRIITLASGNGGGTCSFSSVATGDIILVVGQVNFTTVGSLGTVTISLVPVGTAGVTNLGGGLKTMYCAASSSNISDMFALYLVTSPGTMSFHNTASGGNFNTLSSETVSALKFNA